MTAPLKASSWWNQKIPPMLAVAYFALLARERPLQFSAVGWYFAVYLVAVVGTAGFGHVLTDAFDVEEDRFLGKANLWAPLDTLSRGALIVALLAAAWLPWLLLPAGVVGLTLIGLQFVMFVLYAVPPVRLKERGLFGIVADSMYAHMLPALWTWIPFSVLAGARVPAWFPFLLAGWTLVVGMRHLLQHQVAEFEGDRRAGVGTYVVRHGQETALALIVHRLLPVEVAAFVALLAVIGTRVPLVVAGFVAYVAWKAIKMRLLQTAGPEHPQRTADSRRSRTFGTLIMSSFYERWLAPLILLGLVVREPSYVVLLALHIALFTRGWAGALRDDLPLAASFLRSRRSARDSEDVSRFRT